MKTETKNSDKNYIVGIGASAGGLEALQKLLAALPSDTGFPYIVVQHLSPDYKSLLSEILSKYTDMPVIQAEDGMPVEPNKVFIIQPGKNMLIEGGKLKLIDQKPKELNLPIDIFFRSLAEEAKDRAIAVILSGTGSDGTNGLKAVKENEGLVIVQDINTSKFDGMPRSAIRTGLVDAQISPEDIAVELRHIAGYPAGVCVAISEQEVDGDLMKRIYAILKMVSNVNFTHYKQTTILRRMERRMMINHLEQLSDYVDLLMESPEEVRILSKEVLIGVTSFFRDPEYFQILKDNVITDIVAKRNGDETIRVWVTGCSTGEEVYSIAILFAEVMETMKVKRSVKIFATDLDAEAISTAGKGIYGENIVDAVSTVRLSKYFTRRSNTYVINREIRKMIVFSPHNVFQDPPFGRLDLISCRNMLIYFQPVLQNDLFAIFHQALNDGGYLFLGKSEAVGTYTSAFPVVAAEAKIFTHNSSARVSGAKKVPFFQATLSDEEYAATMDSSYARAHCDKMGEGGAVNVETEILQQFMPPCIIINEKNDVEHTYGDVTNVMHLPVGRYTNNLFDLLTEALKIPVSTLLKDARDRKSRFQYRNISFTGERENMTIDLTVTPANSNNRSDENLYAIVFAPNPSQAKDDAQSVVYDVDKVSSQRITDLEQELAEKQKRLDQSVSEQETVNEELQAANEELLTANEELQSSNEELQSVNEELYTVNSEYQQKLTELSDLNDDIANFLSSTLTGIIFVDDKLSIRRYTDYVTSEFSVMDHDIGRSLAFISYHFPTVDITEICTNVLKTLIPDEREITTSNGKIYFMRVAPYRSMENKILGCVITLVDITTQKQSQASLQTTEKRLSAAQQASDAKSDYLSRVAHEIRTPLSSLAAHTKAAKALAGEDSKLMESLNRISSTVNYMSAIITDISDNSLGDTVTGEETRRPFALRLLLSSVSGIMEPRIEECGVSYETVVDDKFDPAYVGDEEKLRQVLVNFLSYSMAHTKPGGTVTLRTFEEPRRGDMARLCFVIADTGVGIKKEHLPDLFKPFTCQDEGDETLNSSIGLGLSTAYNQIISLDGDVNVESEEGKGCTFTIHVPVERYIAGKDTSESLPSGQNKYRLSGCNVLIAEDNALNRAILGALLAGENITYVEAVNGEQAVKIFEEARDNTFDCILMDMRMPKMDGIRATAAIRASGKGNARTIPIIGVSANSFADDVRQALETGIDDYMTKPIDGDKLFTSMTKLLGRG